jgi:sortase A
MNAPRAVRITRLIALALIATGIVLLARLTIDAARTATHQRAYQRALHSAAALPAAAAATTARVPTIGEPIGWLEIPRVGVSAAVVHGDTDALLKTAIGHLPDTPLPWKTGNSALAGHRDTFFRPLEHVRVDDRLRLKTRKGNFEYRVRETFVVDPEDLWVLDPTPGATLTLITCYPFKYVGNAPRRFIVRAERIEARQADVARSGDDAL